MVRLPPQNRERPVKLLNDNHTGELMRKGEGAKAPSRGRLDNQRRIEAPRPPDGQHDRTRGHKPALQLACQLRAMPAGAVPSQRHERGPVGYPRTEPLRLLGLLGRHRRSSASLAHLALPEAGVSLEAPGVIVDCLTVVGAQLTDGNDTDFHTSAGKAGSGDAGSQVSPLTRLHAYIPLSRCTAATRSIACM